MERWPAVFLPVPGGWGKMGNTVVQLEIAHEPTV
jgi:hypothetical protein